MMSWKASYISILFWLKSMGVTPNKTTMFRFYLWMGCIFSWMIIRYTETYQFLLYIIILTIPIWLLDKVDGDLARYTDQMTDEGKVLDPFIDKIKVY
ncbi:MAG: CDP-alcohol phosphatidyltransferase family protein [Candidatus Gracilibacteria bacterium]|nr:CDP-alcohol phosphatidyltransferase family protein [Candidatus Gracilibacteria bacterium]